MITNVILSVDFGPEYPAEPADLRPALVLGPPLRGPAGPNVIVVPFTTTPRDLRSYVEVEPNKENGLKEISYLQCEQIRSVNKDPHINVLGYLSASDRVKVDNTIRDLLRRMPVNEIGLVDFVTRDPEYPADPASYCPALVLGPPSGWLDVPNVVVAPFTTTPRDLDSYIEVEPSEENGLEETSYLQCEQIRSVNQNRYVQPWAAFQRRTESR